MANYYATALGRGAANGTSRADAWAVASVNWASLPGHTLWLLGTFSTQVLANASGSLGNRIEARLDDPQEPAVFDGLGSVANAFHLAQRDYITVRGGRFKDFTTRAITTSSNSAAVALEVCGNHVRGIKGAANASGIWLAGQNAKVNDNDVSDVGEDGIYLTRGTSGFTDCGNFEVERNKVTRTSQGTDLGDCLQISDAVGSDARVRFNYFDHTDVDSKQCVIQNGTQGGHILFEYNTCLGYDGVNIQAFKNTQLLTCRSTIRRNVFTGGIFGLSADDDSIVESNIIVLMGRTANCLGFVTDGANVSVNHNIAVRYGAGFAEQSEGFSLYSASSTGYSLRNNLAIGWKYGIRGRATSGSVESNNLYYGNETNKVNEAFGGVSVGAGAVLAAPLFLDPTRPWLGLRSDSPCWNAGVFVQGAKDRYGRMYPIPSHIGPWARK